jgi:hypothetical protein
MKKILFLFLIALSVISCQGPVGPEGPQGYGTNWKIINLVANSSDWVENVDAAGLNRYYSAHFSMPEINSNVFNNGTVLSYIMINNSTQQNLPYVRHFQNAAGAFWTQTIDYDYSVGSLNVYVTNSDFVSDPPVTMNFRVVLMW